MANNDSGAMHGALENAPRIAVDAMGGDFGPSVVIPGVLDAAREKPLRLVFVGDSEAIRAELGKADVITSYSIHYTKLYEERGPGCCVRPQNPA